MYSNLDLELLKKGTRIMSSRIYSNSKLISSYSNCLDA